MTAGSLRAEGVQSVAEYDDTVEVLIGSDAPPGAEKAIKRKFAESVVTVRRATRSSGLGGRNFSSGPLYGGEWISAPTSSSSYETCTNGYGKMVYEPNGTFWAATAGHCGNQLNWQQGASLNGNHFGSGGRYNGVYYSGYRGTTQKCDCQVVGPIPASAVSNKMYTTGNDLYPFTRIPTNTSADFYPGLPVCFSGARYADAHSNGIACGTIRTVNLAISSSTFPEYASNNVSFSNLVQISVHVGDHGDSGAPVASYNNFMGIYDGWVNGYDFFSRSTYLEAVTTATPHV